MRGIGERRRTGDPPELRDPRRWALFLFLMALGCAVFVAIVVLALSVLTGQSPLEIIR
jgi:hypothetical protein